MSQIHRPTSIIPRSSSHVHHPMSIVPRPSSHDHRPTSTVPSHVHRPALQVKMQVQVQVRFQFQDVAKYPDSYRRALLSARPSPVLLTSNLLEFFTFRAPMQSSNSKFPCPVPRSKFLSVYKFPFQISRPLYWKSHP